MSNMKLKSRKFRAVSEFSQRRSSCEEGWRKLKETTENISATRSKFSAEISEIIEHLNFAAKDLEKSRKQVSSIMSPFDVT